MTISSDQTLTVTLRMVSPEETLSGNMVGMQSIFSVRDQTGKEIAKGRFLDELEKQFGVMEYSELLKEADMLDAFYAGRKSMIDAMALSQGSVDFDALIAQCKANKSTND